jgi:hypothetical protein
VDQSEINKQILPTLLQKKQTKDHPQKTKTTAEFKSYKQEEYY